ncbi:hypothetical protein OROGR_031403 [Orobanche gracilis]
MVSIHRVEEEYGGWGPASWVAMLCVVMLMVFLPLGMGPGPLQPPSCSTLCIIPVFLAVILLCLTHDSRTRTY